MKIANLTMYDLPEVTAVTDAWWDGIARALTKAGVEDVPQKLTRDLDMDTVWRSPDLLLSQTCGYPYTHDYKDVLRLVATPVYNCDGCDGPGYCSMIMVREADPASGLDDLRGQRAAINSETSQSGYSALRAVVAPFAQDGSFFSQVIASGGHANSLAMVAGGEADVCATDSVTYAMLARHKPAAIAGLRALGRSPMAPGLPYVTRAQASDDLVARLRDALFAVLDDPGLAAVRADLFIAGMQVLPDQAYQRIIDIKTRAEDLGYPRVA